MADLQPTDQFLVNRSDSTQTVDHADLMASLQDTDLMLVNRSDQTYTITGEDLKDSLKPELTLTVVISTMNPEVGSAVTVTPVPGGGTEPFSYTYQWKRDGSDIGGNREHLKSAAPNDCEDVSANAATGAKTSPKAPAKN